MVQYKSFGWPLPFQRSWRTLGLSATSGTSRTTMEKIATKLHSTTKFSMDLKVKWNVFLFSVANSNSSFYVGTSVILEFSRYYWRHWDDEGWKKMLWLWRGEASEDQPNKGKMPSRDPSQRGETEDCLPRDGHSAGNYQAQTEQPCRAPWTLIRHEPVQILKRKWKKSQRR